MTEHSNGTLVRLYKCSNCSRPRFEKEFDAGEKCRCGSTQVKYAEPTFYNVVNYFLNNPKMIVVLIKENVLRKRD